MFVLQITSYISLYHLEFNPGESIPASNKIIQNVLIQVGSIPKTNEKHFDLAKNTKACFRLPDSTYIIINIYSLEQSLLYVIGRKIFPIDFVFIQDSGNNHVKR